MKLYKRTRLNLWIRSVLLGEKCRICGKLDTGGESLFCPECERALLESRYEVCMSCGRFVKDCLCPPAEARIGGCELLVKYAFYVPSEPHRPINVIIHRLKNVKDGLLASFMIAGLAKYVTEMVNGIGATAENCLIVHIPRSAKKKGQAGHDQAYLLARELSRRLKLPRVSLLLRIKDGKMQKTLGVKERGANAHGLFELREGACVAGKIIIIVDDLVTSGATLAEATQLLYSHGATKVVAVALARDY